LGAAAVCVDLREMLNECYITKWSHDEEKPYMR